MEKKFKVRNPAFRERTIASFNDQAVMHTIGAGIDDVEPGRVEISFPYHPSLCQQHGFIHAGIISTVLDSACGYTGSLHIDREALPQMLSLSFTTQYLAPGGSGQVMARGLVTGGGRRTLFIAGELLDSDGRLLATSTGVYKPVRQTGGK